MYRDCASHKRNSTVSRRLPQQHVDHVQCERPRQQAIFRSRSMHQIRWTYRIVLSYVHTRRWYIICDKWKLEEKDIDRFGKCEESVEKSISYHFCNENLFSIFSWIFLFYFLYIKKEETCLIIFDYKILRLQETFKNFVKVNKKHLVLFRLDKKK